MPDCEYCAEAEGGNRVFEDSKAVAFLSNRPASLGHVIIAPREHYTILEQVPDYMAGHLFTVANKVSTKIFETLKAHGTNVVIENGTAAGQGVPHFAINVIPRGENDGISLSWNSLQLTDEQMSSAEFQLREGTKNVGAFESEQKEPVSMDRDESVVRKGEDDDYMLRQLRRLP